MWNKFGLKHYLASEDIVHCAIGQLYIPDVIKNRLNLGTFLGGRFCSTENFRNFEKYPTFDGGFFHVFMVKTNAKFDFLYIVAFALKS